MVLCDFNMVVISNLMSYIKYNPNEKLNVPIIRHVTLNSIRSYNTQFRYKYGELVLCCDSKSYWRKAVFPYYKAGRKKTRDKSNIDWKFIFDTLDILRNEIGTFMPYRMIEVNGAEADDVIATLTKKFHNQEDILILSSDKDFVQLQKYEGVKQYNPTLKRFVSAEDPLAFIKEHILRGDYGDGIPNFLSADDTFVAGERQKRLNTNKLTQWMVSDPGEFCDDEMLRGYKRNQLLVDFDFIPNDLVMTIEEEYRNTTPASKMRMMNYFIEQELESLMDSIDEF